MTQKSFEEFYFEAENQNKYLGVLDSYYDEHHNIAPYAGQIFCPECRHAELAYVSKSPSRRSYLRATDVSTHVGGCSYKYEQAAAKVIKEYFNRLSDRQIENKLHAMLDKLNKPATIGGGAGKRQKENDENPLLLDNGDIGNPKSSVRKSIPQRNLKFPLKKEDAELICLFYGDVYLSLESVKKEFGINKETEEYTIHYLKIQTVENNQKYKIYRKTIKNIKYTGVLMRTR